MLVRFTKKAKKHYDLIPNDYKYKIDEGIRGLKENPPEKSQIKAYNFIKELILAWDPDFRKTTEKEKKDIDEAIEEYKNGEYIEVNI